MSGKKQGGSDKKSKSESKKKSKVELEKKPKNEKSKDVKDPKTGKDNKDGKDGEGKKSKFQGLDETDIKLLKSYTKDLYTEQIKTTKTDVDNIFKNVNKLAGIKPSDTGLSQPSMWDFQADKDMMKQEEPLKVVRCLQIIPPATKEDSHRYIVQAKHGNKFVTELDKELSPVDIKEGMRVGVDKLYKIKLPLPLKISKAVKMMEVEEKPDVTYADIGGCKEQVKKLREVIEMSLTQQKKFSYLGVEPPRGALMTGPPGMGKTLCARAVANRSDACYIRVIGSELAQRYIGEGAQLVRDIFEYARTKSACIIFFDEIDAIGQTRTQGGEHGDNEAGRTLMELIIQLDGFDPRGNIKVLMATNRGDTLDPALLRPGRLDRKIEFGMPDYQGRIEIFKIHTRHMSVARGIRYELLARLCNLASGADIRSICTEAGMYAIRERKKMATEREFLKAIDKVMHRDKKFSALGRYMTHN